MIFVIENQKRRANGDRSQGTDISQAAGDEFHRTVGGHNRGS
jgi:hypothetical protein